MEFLLRNRWKVVIATGVVLLSVCVFVVTSIKSLPDVTIAKKHYPRIQYNPQDPLKANVEWLKYRPRSWVSLKNISPQAVAAIRISEDWGFFQHKGVDLQEIKKSVEKNLKTKQYTRGASTITQQLVKNVFLSQKKTIRRKIREIILARKMEEEFSKYKILEMYLNIVEWGKGLAGIHAAARFYFEKHPSELDAKEGAFLAMLLPSPYRYAKSFRDKKLTPYASKTVNNILYKLVRANVISEQYYEILKNKPLSFEEAYEAEYENEELMDKAIEELDGQDDLDEIQENDQELDEQPSTNDSFEN